LKLDDLPALQAELKERSSQKIDQLCEFLGKLYNIFAEWSEVMAVFVKKAIDEVNIDSISGEPMDINYYVKIKKVLYVDQSATCFIRGVVFR
jgi:hypothetical protein